MQCRWVGKNVKLDGLKKSIEVFFVEKNFVLKKDMDTIICSKRFDDKLRVVVVKVEGDSNDFAVEFQRDELTRSLAILGFLATMLGGGAFIRDRLRDSDLYEKLESEFWAYLEREIIELEGSAKGSV